jgi:hypothetical protein
VLPGAPLVSYALPAQLLCSQVAEGVARLAKAKVGVINISLGSPSPCATLYRAVEQAIGAGIVVTAAAGNDYQQGNPVIYPAAFPHVLSVAAVDAELQASAFSNANAGVDLSAPGERVPLAIPLAFDTKDGARDGITLADGTSFAAPMVAGAAAWVRTVRPELTGGQIADTLRIGARDLPPSGWDRDTGWGLLDVSAALSIRTPRIDPLEPNDDMPLVDGVYFGRPDPPIYTGHGSRSVRATVDAAEDPFDVYRIRVPRRSSLKAVVNPYYGDPDLYAFDGSARDVNSRRALVQRSAHDGGPERVDLVNRGRRTLTGYVVVNAASTSGSIDASYRLTVSRTRHRR